MAALPAWFTAPPTIGGPDQYQVLEASTQAQYDQYVQDGYKGPYATKGAAQAQAAGQTKTAVSTEAQLPGLPNPLAGLEAVARITGDIGRAVTDGKLWRSLGWAILGILLFFAGLFLWLGKDIKSFLPPVLPV